MCNKSYDIFISHASEDKDSFVSPLANALSAFGVRVWYDQFSLKLGDSLSRSIDEGLGQSDYGLVVLSRAFFAKNWPEYELRGLNAREMQGKKIILPIWHNVSFNDVVKFSPPLADKLAIRSDSGSPTQIAVEVIEVIRPDILTKIHRRLASRSTPTWSEAIDPKEIRWGTIQHKELADELIRRIRLIRAALFGVGSYSHSMEYWMDGFKHDSHPSKEVGYWERLSAVYLEYIKMTRIQPAQNEAVVSLIFALLERSSEQHIAGLTAKLPDGALEKLRNLIDYKYPYYDIKEEIKMHKHARDGLEIYENIDKESFPEDLPEDLIKQLEKGI